MLRRMILAASLTTTLAGCGTFGKPPLPRSLPETALVIPAPTPLPEPKPGQPARVVAAENRAVAAENIRKLEAAGRSYDALRREYAGETAE